ncbi:complement factor H-related protein 1-like [Archocentrus centrarchus]|uniref:complement factor H-related protein 1-like n=1 Tax=Archocentrus centrarchus TaxID=63155 RepID=UPI0011E9F561|nr:complement factor H-related protein 1-like [Archocentrus centrarchus]
MTLFHLLWLFLLWLNPNESLQQSEVKCELTLPPATGTLYEPANRNSFSPGEKLRVTCGDRYWILDSRGLSAETTCKRDGEWTFRPVCQEVTCSRPRDTFLSYWGAALSQRDKMGDSVIYGCKTGYKRTDVGVWATCTREGWEPNPLCQANADICSPPLKVENAVVTTPYQQEYPSGSTVTYQCFDKYTMEGNATIECTAGEWEELNIKCILAQGCERSPHISDGQIIGREISQYNHNETVEYVCHSGYIMEGEPFKTCINGEWIGEMRCRPVQGCGRPPYLSDGDTKTTTGIRYQHNDRVEYVCQAYYVMEGGPFKTCIDGEWTGEIRCLQPCTVTEEELNSHNIHFKHLKMDNPAKMYSAHNDVIEFVCTRGRRVGAVGMRQKCEHGVMELPTCQ